MSTTKHKAYRKVLEVKNFNTTYKGQTIKCKQVLWCLMSSLTNRTVKTNHIGLTTYVGSYKFNGVTARMPRKIVSISLKNPLNSKFFKDSRFPHERDLQDVFNKAYRQFILGAEIRCKNLTGTVKWFRDDGSGWIKENETGQTYPIHACNIKGAKTWYPDTACMYVKEGEEITFDLADMGDHLTTSNVRGNIYFDEAKWNALDQSKLSFKCDEKWESHYWFI